MEKVCENLINVVSTNTNSAVIGSIITSLGILRYRNEELLTLLSLWIINNSEKARPQEISSLVMTLAHVGYAPENFQQLFEVKTVL